MNVYITEAEKRLRAALTSYQRARDAMGIHLSLSKMGIGSDISNPTVIVVNVLRDQFKSAIGDIYALKNGDVVIVYRGRNERLVKECLYQVQYLFSDDGPQLSFSEEMVWQYSQIFYPADWSNFLALCEQLSATLDVPPKAESASNFQGSIISLFGAIIEDALVSVAWNNMVKTTAICKYRANGASSKVLDEIHADIDNLTTIIGDNFDVMNNPYLRSYFKDFIDLKLLVKLVDLLRDKPGESAYMLNLNITTLSSPEFWVLAESLTDNIKKRIIIAIAVGEVFSDMAYYLQVREQLVEHGFKLCLDCLDYISFLQIDREALGFDLVRLHHKAAFDMDKLSEVQQQLKAKVFVSGSSRVVLSIPDTSLVELCQKLGLVLFQINE